jgi:hypothetical protein
MNIYTHVLKENQLKLLNLYNLDSVSSTRGYGDRKFWAWKTIDFPNATFQGGVHALAISIKLNIAIDNAFYLKLIDSIIKATKELTYANGSVEEAYPRENSFCVTALVAFDILSAIDILNSEFSESQISTYLDIVRPLINYISKYNEEHAVISNHVATAVAAISIWNKVSGEDNPRWKELLGIIYENQSKEGWFKEYEGPDPGYQTLCTYYLSAAYIVTEDQELLLSLQKSLYFLKHFIHPDGSIGGLYGSRNTEVYYPGGIVCLSDHLVDANLVRREMAKGIEAGTNLLPQYIDSDNYIPLLNSYAYAALTEESLSKNNTTAIPFYRKEHKILFEEAGLELFSNDKYFSILNYKKGGCLKVFNLQNNTCEAEIGGVYGKTSKYDFTSQKFNNATEYNNGSFVSLLYKFEEAYPTFIQTIIIRAMALTIFRSVFFGELFKKTLVKLLMTGKKPIKGSIEQKILYHEDYIELRQFLNLPKNAFGVENMLRFKSIHMASSGYNLPQHFRLNKQTPRLKIYVS